MIYSYFYPMHGLKTPSYSEMASDLANKPGFDAEKLAVITNRRKDAITYVAFVGIVLALWAYVVPNPILKLLVIGLGYLLIASSLWSHIRYNGDFKFWLSNYGTQLAGTIFGCSRNKMYPTYHKVTYEFLSDDRSLSTQETRNFVGEPPIINVGQICIVFYDDKTKKSTFALNKGDSLRVIS